MEPVAQALATLMTGMPVWPISFRMRWPTMALAWYRLPLAKNWTSFMETPASSRALRHASDARSMTVLSG